jgi:hypothetical protein
MTADLTEAPPADRSPRRTFSGTAFVIACVLAVFAFVAFLVYVSPILLARTLESAPPPAPAVVADGLAGGERWTATAIELAPEEPCLEVAAGSVSSVVCTQPRGGAVRAVEGLVVGPESVVLHGIVDPRTTAVRLSFAGAPAVDVEPSYVDFGFPLGFFALELPPGARLTGVVALDRDGDVRGTMPCSGEADASACGR